MKCKKCGEELLEDAMFCSNCGSAVYSNDGEVYENGPTHYQSNRVVVIDKPSFVLNVVSFISPIIGYIMWFCMRKSTPNKAKSCAIWATISFVLNLISILVFGL